MLIIQILAYIMLRHILAYIMLIGWTLAYINSTTSILLRINNKPSGSH